MPKESIFQDEWRECLRAHFMDVVRRDDQRTLKTLLRVMHDTGFTDDELAELRVRATLRAEDMPDDFVPDIHVFQVNADTTPPDSAFAEQGYIEEVPVHPPEVDEEEITHLLSANLPEEQKDDPDLPQQLSLF
jgi:hypothetical protein